MTPFLLWLLVLLTVLVFLPGMISGNSLPKTFWAAATVGLGLALSPRRRCDGFRLSFLGVVWLAYLAWALISLFWALQPRVGFERWLALLLLTLAYLLARRLRFWESEFFWKSFCVLTGLAALIGILQYFFLSFPLLHELPGTAVPRGTMGNRNYASMYFMVTLPFVAWYYFRTRGGAILLPLSSFLLGGAFILLATTRGAWLGLATGLIFFLASGGLRKISRNLRPAIFIAVLALLALVMGVLVKPPPKIAGLLSSNKAAFQKTAGKLFNAHTRVKFWKETWGLTNPLLGAGFGNFPIVATPFAPEAQVNALDWEVHNDYLQAYVDLGIPGAILFTLAFMLLIRLAWKGRESGLILAAGASIVALSFMQFTTFTTGKVSTQLWIAGVAAMLNNRALGKPLFRLRMPYRLALGFNYLTVLWLFLFTVAAAYTIRGDRELRKEYNEIRQILAYRKILDNPGRHTARQIKYVRKLNLEGRLNVQNRFHQLIDQVMPRMFFDANVKHIFCHHFAKLATSFKDYNSATAFARRALDLHPNDRTSLVYLARSALREGRLNEAFRYLKRGVEVFGYNAYQPFFVVQLARLYRSRGVYVEAMEIEKKMAANRVSSPNDPSPVNLDNKVPVDPEFNWSDCRAATSYQLYIWKTREQTPSSPRLSGLTESRARLPGRLDPDMIYIWQIRAIGRYGKESGPLWIFRTEKEVGE